MNNPMSSAVGIRVSLSVRQGNGEVKKTHVTCGLGYETPLANYDLDTQSWKTFGDISLWGDCPLLANLPPSGMTRNGVLYPQPAWGPIIDATGSSLWPTPTADDASNVNPKPNRFMGLVAAVNGQESQRTGKLNPMWVEWLMGFPIGWTDLEDSATQ